jgi:hypothetical protein
MYPRARCAWHRRSRRVGGHQRSRSQPQYTLLKININRVTSAIFHEPCVHGTYRPTRARPVTQFRRRSWHLWHRTSSCAPWFMPGSEKSKSHCTNFTGATLTRPRPSWSHRLHACPEPLKACIDDQLPRHSGHVKYPFRLLLAHSSRMRALGFHGRPELLVERCFHGRPQSHPSSRIRLKLCRKLSSLSVCSHFSCSQRARGALHVGLKVR